MEERLTLLEGTVGELGDAVTALMRRGEDTAVRSWLTVDDAETAELMLCGLAQWLDAVWRRYPGSALPDCWALHPCLIEELWVSMQTWLLAERKPGDYRVRDAWHERSRPGLARRIRESGDKVGSCALDQHAAGPALGLALPDLAAIASLWIRQRTSPPPVQRLTL